MTRLQVLYQPSTNLYSPDRLQQPTQILLMVSSSNSTTILTYLDWNESIGRYCFNRRTANLRIRFAVDPLVLQRASAEGLRRYHFPTPESAASDFRMAVTRHIDTYGWRIGNTAAGKIPLGIAKLALQILAVFEMAADDEVGKGYWAALHRTLGRPIIHHGRMPDDLSPITHQANWTALADWANEKNKCQLGILPSPEEFEGGRRHVRLPMFHGLLRSDDIQGLFRFFERVGIQPGEEVDPEDLRYHLQVYADNFTVFRGTHARRVLQDERLPFAANQIANAACQWDGQRVDLAKSRGSIVRLWIGVHTTRDPRVSGGLVKIDSRGRSMDVPGVFLEQLLGLTNVRQQGAPVAYRPIDRRLLVAVRSLLHGRYVESRYLRPGDQVVFVKPLSTDAARIERELTCIAVGERVEKLGSGTVGLPDGWTLYRLRVRESLSPSDVPDFLEERIKIAEARLQVSGGLQVRGAWVEGAGPTLTLKGGEATVVVVDGTEYEVQSGCLYPEQCPVLSTIGVHEAWLPGHHRTRVQFRIAQPRPARFPSPIVAAGWVWAETPEWPSRLDASSSPPLRSVHGPVVQGDWPAATPFVDFAPPGQAAVRLAIALQHPLAIGDPAALAALKTLNEEHPNLIVRQLARAIRPWARKRGGDD